MRPRYSSTIVRNASPQGTTPVPEPPVSCEPSRSLDVELPGRASHTELAPAARRRRRSHRRRLVTGTSSAVSVEQYRKLAAMLHEEQVRSQLKTVIVTSALPGEGKTLTVVNLALTLSESYAAACW